MATETAAEQNEKSGLSVARNVKIGFFHLGSGMADVLTTGVWNRIMISDLGVAATPVSLLVSLRYFLAPLGIWAGRMSDKVRILGFKRLFWVWFGRGLMVLSTFGLGYATSELTRSFSLSGINAGIGLWLLIIFSMLLFSFGNALSGTTFLALIYDRANDDQRGRAVGLVWTMLLLGFTVGGILFSILLPESETATGLSFTPDDLFMLFVITGVTFSGLWFFSLLGEERRRDMTPDEENAVEIDERSLRSDLSLVWQNSSMRFFLFYLTLSMFFAFSQDPVLEPFAGDVFDMPASETNRFAAYWGSTSILGSLFFLWLSRKVPALNNIRLSQMGVITLTLTFALLTAAAVFQMQSLLIPLLLLLGLGLGMWNIGTLGLMMDMSPLGRAGTFLGFWSMSVTLARGGGITGGGVLRDVGFALSGNPAVGYELVFGVGVFGLLVAYYCLLQINMTKVPSVAPGDTSSDPATALSAALD
jgi:BCD family chlorophyll transporter-like MFS transporter